MEFGERTFSSRKNKESDRQTEEGVKQRKKLKRSTDCRETYKSSINLFRVKSLFNSTTDYYHKQNITIKTKRTYTHYTQTSAISNTLYLA